MNHSCIKLYNFPEELIRIIHNNILILNKKEYNKNMLKEIKYICLRINTNRNYKNIINEINNNN